MESEENLSREKQNLEQNISVENSSSLDNTGQKPLIKKTQSKSVISPENNQKISNAQTKSLIELALKDLHLSREQLEKELKEQLKLRVKDLEIQKEVDSSKSKT